MASPSPAAAPPDQQLTRLRTEIERCGTALVTSDQLQALCPKVIAISDQFLRIAQIARAEGWQIDFETDGVVRVISPVASRRCAVY